MAAESYQQSSLSVQLEGGKLFIQTEMLPQPRDAILDLGCGTVLYWIPNKEDAFKNMFNSLKAGGKIVIEYSESLPPFEVSALEELNPEIKEQVQKMLHGVARVNVDRLCMAAGFDIVKSYYTNDKTVVFESMEGLLKWFWSTSHGVFDLQVVTQERIQRFLSRVGNPPFDFSADSINCRLIAEKPWKPNDLLNNR
ncbi:hypothetical protein ACROYT_G039534 [Oculina patagonica]